MKEYKDSVEALGLMLLIGVGVYGAYQGYRATQAASKALSAGVKSVSDGIDSAVTVVTAVPRAVVNAAQTAYAEVATFVTRQQHYSPQMLDGSMSKADAIKLATDIAARDAADQTTVENDALVAFDDQRAAVIDNLQNSDRISLLGRVSNLGMMREN